ncbi:peptidoglycan DD-metalloendopeptidase family protein [Virgibacillus kekensis]|uniref:Peptidoglycan DD-metalloendopeptidase family protein n=1 Tax=Virgibacillus kekensis TaxID=202261 RepID=A0ABV9DI31_9BACI
MKEENNGTPKNKWSRIFRKKWFFPAVYLTIAAVLLSVVVWYQNLDNQMQESQQQQDAENYTPQEHTQDAQSVLNQQEVIQMPVANPDQAEIVTKFYDYDAEQKAQEQALVVYNNRFYQSTGIDIAAADGKSFDVMASLSGTVAEVKEDPLLGNVVTLSHENEVVTHYASLDEVNVQAGDEVAQGDVLGTAGQSVFGQESGVHVHFEIRKDNKAVNPEEFFNQPLSNLIDSETDEEKAGTDDSSATEDAEGEDAASEETTEEQKSDASKEEGNSDPSDDTESDESADEQEDPAADEGNSSDDTTDSTTNE